LGESRGWTVQSRAKHEPKTRLTIKLNNNPTSRASYTCARNGPTKFDFDDEEDDFDAVDNGDDVDHGDHEDDEDEDEDEDEDDEDYTASKLFMRWLVVILLCF
jgi:hypothetical protein